LSKKRFFAIIKNNEEKKEKGGGTKQIKYCGQLILLKSIETLELSLEIFCRLTWSMFASESGLFAREVHESLGIARREVGIVEN
jgi:hypothetical protein